ncbi:MAG: hypothetical protein HQ556_01740 [Candidatus Marinimicrobia bacterium]|nr:hypothetical protein [Candidatus Neomarinimicrobiota bacterium]
MPNLNKPQRLILSLLVPIISLPLAGELILLFYKPTLYGGRMTRNGEVVTPEWYDVLLDYPAGIITFVIFVLMLELYLWRTIQPRKKKSFSRLKTHWSKLATIKGIGLLSIHIIASVSIPIALFSINVFQASYVYDVEKTAILIFCCYWGLLVVIWALRWASSISLPSTSDDTELDDSSNDNNLTNVIRPNVLSLIDESEDKRFGVEIEKIENIKITRRVDEK